MRERRELPPSERGRRARYVRSVIDVNDVNELGAHLHGSAARVRPSRRALRLRSPASTRWITSDACEASSVAAGPRAIHRTALALVDAAAVACSLRGAVTFPSGLPRLRSFMSYAAWASAARPTAPRRSHVNDVNPKQPRHVHRPPAHKATKHASGAGEPGDRNATYPITRTKSTARSHRRLASSTPRRLFRRRSSHASRNGRPGSLCPTAAACRAHRTRQIMAACVGTR